MMARMYQNVEGFVGSHVGHSLHVVGHACSSLSLRKTSQLSWMDEH